MLDTTSTVPNHSNDCPGGCPSSGRLTLLTSMVRYYVCDNCERHWHVARLDVPEPPGVLPGYDRLTPVLG